VGASDQWQQAKYKEVFDDEIRGLTRRLASDPSCRIEDLEGILKSLYILDGTDQGGHGSLPDTIMAARIAAYEHFITQLKAEKL